MTITEQTMSAFVKTNPEHAQFTLAEIERLIVYRAAVRAGFYNEGIVELALTIAQQS